MDAAGSRSHAGWMAALMLAGLPLLTAGGPASRPETVPTSQPAETVLALDLMRPGAGEPALALEQSLLKVSMTGRPGQTCDWRIGCDDIALAAGRAVFSRAGLAETTLRLPSVRVRCRFIVVVRSDRAVSSRHIDVVPRQQLADVTQTARRLGVGVIDPSGGTQAALAEEGLAIESLSSRLLQDAFDGEVILLAGYESEATLDESCQRLAGRIFAGLTAVIFAPPVGWERWQIACTLPDSPLIGRARMGGGLGRFIKPGDISHASWPVRLVADQQWQTLISVSSASGQPAPAPGRERLLAAWRPFGRGRIAVVAATMTNPRDNAAQRVILDELVLWGLSQQKKTESNPEGG